jgi:phage major head subunit gpT-like protein
MANPFLQISHDAQEALTQFSAQFDAAFAAATEVQWASQFGVVDSSGALKTTYPITVSQAGYRERKGDEKLRTLGERSLSMTTKEWYDGVEIEAIKLEAPDFMGWGKQPQLMAAAAARMPNLLIADLLHANPLLDFYSVKYDGGVTASAIRLFADAHPVNIFDTTKGTFDNDHSITRLDKTSVEAIKNRFRAKKGPDGRRLGLNWTHVLVPSILVETFKDFFEVDYTATIVTNVAGSENVSAIPNNNRHKGSVVIVEAPDLQDDAIFYPIDATSALAPWVIMTGGSPEEIVYDKTSEKYKDTGKVATKRILRAAAAAALPHAIERITITG